MITVHEITQGDDEWHKLRSGKYTGSNADKLLRFGAIEYSKTETTGFKGNFYTKRGHALEPEAIELYEAITNQNVDRPGFVTNSEFPGCGYSPDGLTDQILIEVKCFDEKHHMELINGQIPLKILAQVHFGMLITERPVAHLIAYNHNLDLDRYTIKDQFKIIIIKSNRNIQNNFKRILNNERVLA